MHSPVRERGGFVNECHDNIKNTLTSLLTKVCLDVEFEPHLFFFIILYIFSCLEVHLSCSFCKTTYSTAAYIVTNSTKGHMMESPQHESFPLSERTRGVPRPSTTKKLSKYKAIEAGVCSSNQPLVSPTKLTMYKWKSIIDISNIISVQLSLQK